MGIDVRQVQGGSLTYDLLERLGQSIVIGDFDKTGFPTEMQLCAKFKSSRTVAREAVKMLTAKGLLTARPRQGTRVEAVSQWNLLDPDITRWMTERPYSHKIYRDLTEVRLAVEPVAAALAARRAGEGDLKAIGAALDRMRRHAEHHDRALHADIEFHVAILKASGNPFLIQLRELIHTALTISIGLTNRVAGHTASLPDHEAVFLAIAAGDSGKAEAAMRAIITESLVLVESVQAE